MIRTASMCDVEALVKMGERFHAESPSYRARSFCAKKVRKQLVDLIVGSGVVFLVEVESRIVGAMAGWLEVDWFGHDAQACELCVFVEQDMRGQRVASLLMTAFEEWARMMGATTVLVGVSAGICPDKAVAMYEALGYRISVPLLKKELVDG